MLYEGPNNYNGGGMTMMEDSKHKRVSVGNINTAPENTEDDEVGAKSFSAWEDGGLTGWGD